MNKIDVCKALLWAHSVLQHEALTPEERAEFHSKMIDCFSRADILKIPFRLQNALLHISTIYNARCCYLDSMLTEALKHARLSGEVLA